MNQAKRAPLGLVFAIVFLDIIGFSIVFPLFPAMLTHYVALEGETGWCGELVTFLQRLFAADDFAVIALFGGVLGSLYAFLQFLFAPIWGALSDRTGRRPVLLLTLAGTALSYVLWTFSGSFALLVAARLLGGMMAGNISTASAVVADTTSGRDRARGMGILGMAIGLGFVIGPAIGGSLAALAPAPPDGAWRSGFALHPFSMPALAALGLALLNLAWVAARFRETLPAEQRGRTAPGAAGPTLHPFARLKAIAEPRVVRVSLVNFLYTTVFTAMEFTLTFLAHERFDYGARKIAGMFVFVGLVIAFVNGGLVRHLAPRLGEKRVALTGIATLVPGFLAIGAARGPLAFYGGLLCMAVGSALTMPCLSALASRYAPPERQGLALGTFRSLASLARAVGPLLGGLCYWRLGSAAPYYAGAALLVLPLGLAAGLSPLPALAGEPAHNPRSVPSDKVQP